MTSPGAKARSTSENRAIIQTAILLHFLSDRPWQKDREAVPLTAYFD
jgi:hypothetical protein